MFLPFLLLILLVAATPAALFLDAPVGRSIAAAVVALAAAMVAFFVQPGEGGHLARLWRPWLPIAALPALLMVVQALPISVLAHPIWASAAEALGQPLAGAISIDPGVTVIVLGRYLEAATLMFVATAVAIERQRAEAMLHVMAAVATVMAAVLVGTHAGGLTGIDFRDGGVRAALDAVAGLGMLFALAVAIHAVERLETRHERDGATVRQSAVVIAAAFGAAAMCGVTALLWAPPTILFAGGCGLGVLVLGSLARRLGAGTRVTTAVAAAGLVGAIAFAVASGGGDGRTDPTVRFAISGPTDAVPRMTADLPWLGSGAGTFAALLTIYAGVDDFDAPPHAPTTAASIAIEFGRSALMIAIVIGLAIAAVMFRGAMTRGRDWIYPALAASVTVTVTIEAFVDATLCDAAVSTLVCVTLGLGLAQRLSRAA